jgi:predicted nucleotide-binding protein
MNPSVAEIVDFFLRLEDDPKRRQILGGMPFDIFSAAVEDGLFERLQQDAFARLAGKAIEQGLIAYESTHAAVPEPGYVWTDSDFQNRSGYYVTTEGRQMVDLFRRQGSHPTLAKEAVSDTVEDPTRVMVVHGRDLRARNDLFELLRALGLKPIGWNEAVIATGTATPYNGEAVDAAFRTAQAAVVLFTPDERVRLRADLRKADEPTETEWSWQPRPNVFYEGGIAFTSHPKETVIVEHGRPNVPTDLAGRNTIRTEAPDWRQDFAERLRGAGCPVDTSGSAWLAAGEFTPPAKEPEEAPMPVAIPAEPGLDLPREW